jgi:1,2-diacylglycerol 3-alpha-glucosyltransferase
VRPLTIGIFMEHYEPFVSGVITSVNGLMAELENRGHKVYIVCPAVKGHIDTNPRVIRIPSISAKSFDNATIGYPTPAAIRKLMRIRFDLIHSQDVFYTAGIGLLIARRQKIPYIQTYHTLWHRFIEQYKLAFGFKVGSALAMAASYPVFFGFKTTADFIKNYDQRLSISGLAWHHMVNMSRQADAVVVPSTHLQEDLSSNGLDVDIQQIPNGVMPIHIEVDDILPPKDEKSLRIISVARFSEEKRLDVLVEAFSKLKIKAELVMAGDGPATAAIERLAIEKGVAGRIRFMGSLSNGGVRKLMRECDVLALASYNFDNQPMVILEAIEAGLPVVYCDPSLREGLSSANSVLAENSVDGLARALASVKDNAKRSAMAGASLELASEYSMPAIAERIIKVYERTLAAAAI